MPNTLAHFAVHGIATRSIIRNADLKWVYLGCVIADLPWVLQRAALLAAPGLDRYDLRLYAVVQATLAGCLALSGCLALLSARPARVFGILALGSLLHLLLDACQIKWANGVHLIAPVSWDLWSIGLFWPESLPTYLLTGAGLAYFAYASVRARSDAVGISLRSPRRLLAAGGLLALYLAGPPALLSGPERADNHSVGTLRDRADRPGRPVAFDRNRYLHRAGGDVLRTFAGEDLAVEGETLDHSAIASIQATFHDADTIEVRDIHDHSAWPRDWASYLGLGLIAATWIGHARLPRRRSSRSGAGET